jgi:hypothetical protein
LTPSSVIQELLSLLKDLIEPNATVEHTQTVISMIITPLVSQVTEVATRLGSPDNQVYLMNCIGEVIKFLQTLPDTELLCKNLQGQIESQVDRLSAEQSSWLVAQLGIGHIYTILHEKIEDPLSSVPGMDPSSLKIFSVSLRILFVLLMRLRNDYFLIFSEQAGHALFKSGECPAPSAHSHHRHTDTEGYSEAKLPNFGRNLQASV